MVHQIQILRPGSNKIPVILQTLSGQAVKLKKGTKAAHVMVGNMVPTMLAPAPKMDKNVSKRAAGNAPKAAFLGTLLQMMIIDLGNFLITWILVVFSHGLHNNSSQLENFFMDYQHLFVMNMISS